jgi:hypothetical protein
MVIGLDAPGGPPEQLERMIEHPDKILVATGDPPPLEMTIDIHDAEDHQDDLTPRFWRSDVAVGYGTAPHPSSPTHGGDHSR